MGKEALQDEYKERLYKIIAKKIKTSMICPISQFEKTFGSLWGHGKHESELTEEEKINRDKWNECRTNILDNGHKQIRNIRTELKCYDVIWNRYTMIFKPKGTI